MKTTFPMPELLDYNSPKMNEVVTINCYDSEDKMKRGDAIRFYLEGIVCSEGCERERYVNIFLDLLYGEKHCTDLAY